MYIHFYIPVYNGKIMIVTFLVWKITNRLVFMEWNYKYIISNYILKFKAKYLNTHTYTDMGQS